MLYEELTDDINFTKKLSQSAVALVTGGASGLGRATVERFVRIGTKVILVDLPASTGNSIAKDLGDGVVFVPTDVTSEQDVTSAIETTKSKFGRLDVVVNCAGTASAHQTYNFNKGRPGGLQDFADQITVIFTIHSLFTVSGKLFKFVGEHRWYFQYYSFISWTHCTE